MDHYIERLKEEIDALPLGSAFVVSDFSEICDYQTAKRSLARLCERGEIRRVIRGVYDNPAFSNLLQEYVAPDTNQIAMAIARNYNWTIIPSGNAALNMLGLSTQVPSKWEYCSSGPYRDYKYGQVSIVFKHSSNKEIEGFSFDTALLIQAIKAIGKDRIDKETIERLKERTSLMDKYTLLQESKYTTSWIFTAIKNICGEE